MIKYTLNCKNGHQFDSWFSDSESFEKLRKKGHLECAICSSKEVEKSLMAPRITSDSERKNKTLISAQSALEKEIRALKKKDKDNCNRCGRKFSHRSKGYALWRERRKTNNWKDHC